MPSHVPIFPEAIQEKLPADDVRLVAHSPTKEPLHLHVLLVCRKSLLLYAALAPERFVVVAVGAIRLTAHCQLSAPSNICVKLQLT